MKKILTGLILLCSFTLKAQTELPAKANDVAPLLIGETVPSSIVTSMNGENENIQSIVRKKKTVLIFYRGGWCPYCNKHLSELGMIEKDLLGLGYQVVAVSPDTPENLHATMIKDKLSYQLYADSKGMLIKAMGIAYKVPSNYAATIRQASAGMNTELLPVPAVFILDTNGDIQFMYVNPDFKQRINGKLLLAAAKAL
jgi:peroxiredoxin